MASRQKHGSKRNSQEDTTSDTGERGNDTRNTWTVNPLIGLDTKPIRPARNTGPNWAVNPLNSLPASGFPTKREIAKQKDTPPPPAPETVEKWQKRLAAQRNAIDHPKAAENVAALKQKMQEWPDFARSSDFKEATQLSDALSSHKDVVEGTLHRDLVNMLAQPERQQIILGMLDNLGNQQALGVVGGESERLEAIAVWKTIDGTTGQSGSQDADYWHPGWTKVLYVPELTSAPWNVGWPTGEEGVKGAGRALIAELTKKARENGCDGIGLFGLRSNIDFYLATGFEFKEGFNRANPGGFPPLFLKVPRQQQ